MTLELRKRGLNNLTYSYSEKNIYKSSGLEQQKEIYVILPEGKITKEKDQLIYFLESVFLKYFQLEEIEQEISNDCERLTFKLS